MPHSSDRLRSFLWLDVLCWYAFWYNFFFFLIYKECITYRLNSFSWEKTWLAAHDFFFFLQVFEWMILHFKLASISKVNFFNELAMPYISLGWQKMVTILNSPAHQIPDQGVPLQMKKKKNTCNRVKISIVFFFFLKFQTS